MKKHLFIILLMSTLLANMIYQSFYVYNSLSLSGVLAGILIETICILFIIINFMALIKWSKFEIKYHIRIVLIIAFVSVVSFNTIIFKNDYAEYLMIPTLIASFLGFYFIYSHKKQRNNPS